MTVGGVDVYGDPPSAQRSSEVGGLGAHRRNREATAFNLGGTTAKAGQPVDNQDAMLDHHSREAPNQRP